MAFELGNGQEKTHSFEGRVTHWHTDGRHIFVEFDKHITEDERRFDVGWYDAAKNPRLKRRGYETGARVRGEAEINDTNLAVIQTLERIPRTKLITLLGNLINVRTIR